MMTLGSKLSHQHLNLRFLNVTPIYFFSNICHQHRCSPLGLRLQWISHNNTNDWPIETYLLFVSVFFVFVKKVRTEFEQNKDECQCWNCWNPNSMNSIRFAITVNPSTFWITLNRVKKGRSMLFSYLSHINDSFVSKID